MCVRTAHATLSCTCAHFALLLINGIVTCDRIVCYVIGRPQVVPPGLSMHDRLADFVRKSYFAKRIPRENKEAVFNEFVRITNDAGFTANFPGDEGSRLELDDASIAVVLHATHAMRRKLLELHPELAEELRSAEQGPQR